MSRAENDSHPALLAAASRIADAEQVDWTEVSRDLDTVELQGRGEGLQLVEAVAGAFRAVAPEVREAATERPVLFRWGTLEVLKEIGAGSFGQVYQAHDPALNRDVALKLRPAGPSHLDRAGQRYLNEARRLARLRHPNVLSVYGAAAHDGRVGFWTDLIDGQTLAQRVREGGPFGAEEATTVGLTLCRALAAVHGTGLVHGDVKPANIMRERGGRIVLLDFGAASRLPQSAEDNRVGSLQGTPFALAPELLEGQGPTASSDIYALGVVLYFLVTGEYPIEGGSLRDVLEQHGRRAAVRLRDRRAGLPAGFVAVVDRALDPDPAARFASAGEMEQALRAVEDVGAPASRAAVAGMPRNRAWLVGLAVAAALGLAGFLAWRSAEPPADPSVAGSAAFRLLEAEPLADFPGNHGQGTPSPDGRMLAFVSDQSGTPQVWISSLSGGNPLQVTFGEVPASRPRWTATDQIVFARRNEGIWSVAPLGGEPRQIVAQGNNPAVSPDGRWLVYEHERRLWRVSTDGGEPKLLESVPPRMFAAVAATPAISPDGSRVAYFMQETGPHGDLWVVPLEGGEPERLTYDQVEAGDPAWSPDGEHIIYWSRRHGSKTLWQLPAAGGSPRPLTAGAGEDSEPAITPDGSRLTFTSTRHRWVLTSLDPETGASRDLIEQRQAIWLPEAGPDGRIAFFLARGAGYPLFTFAADSGRLAQVTSGDEGWNLHPRWSADGEALYYYEARPTPAFRRLPARGGESALIAADWTWQTHMHAVPSPDGTRIAYLDQDAASGTTRVWGLGDDRHVALPDPHLHGLQWSPDGAWVMGFTHQDDIRLCPPTGEDCRVLAAGLRPRFATHGEQVYFHRRTTQPGMWSLWRVSLDGTDERELGLTGPHHPLDPTFAVTPTGEIVYTRFERGRSELWSARLAPGS